MSFGKAKKQNNKIHIGSRAFDVFLIAFMIIVSIIFLYPFLNVIATSLSSNRMITTGQVTFFPKEFHLDGYKALFSVCFPLLAYGTATMKHFFTLRILQNSRFRCFLEKLYLHLVLQT